MNGIIDRFDTMGFSPVRRSGASMTALARTPIRVFSQVSPKKVPIADASEFAVALAVGDYEQWGRDGGGASRVRGRRRTTTRRQSMLAINVGGRNSGCRGCNGGATVKTNAQATPSRNGAEPASRSAISNGGGRADNVAGCNNFLPVFFDIIVPDVPPPRGALASRPAFPFFDIVLSERPLLPYFFWRCVCVMERHVHDQRPCPIEPTLNHVGLHIHAVPVPEVCGRRGV